MKERDFNTPKDIIAYFVSKLNAWINVAGVEACGENQYKILTCNTKWAQRGFEISEIGKIIEVDFNNYIKVETETEPENQNFELYEVKFIHGTTVQVNAEVSRSEFCDNPFKRLPVVYLKEFTELERKTKYSQDLIRVNLPLELHFLTIGNHTDWTTKDAYNEAIYPMLGLCNAFQEVLFKEKAFVGEWEEENLEFAPKFGVRYNFDKGNGVEKNYFDDELSGVSAKFDLPLKMNFCKSCKEGEPPLPKFTLFVNEEEFKTFEGKTASIEVVNQDLEQVGILQPENNRIIAPNAIYKNSDNSFEQEILSGSDFISEDIKIEIKDQSGNILIEENIPSNKDFDKIISVNLTTTDTDRYGNVLPTILRNSLNPNKDWNAHNFADEYLSKLTNPPTGAQETAVFQFYQDMIDIGAYQKSAAIGLVIGGNADDHKLNARYPYDNGFSPAFRFIGSPTHSANGIATNGTTQLIRTGIMPSSLPVNDRQISLYINSDLPISQGIAMGAGLLNLVDISSLGFYGNFSDNSDYWNAEGNRTRVLNYIIKGMKSIARRGAAFQVYSDNGIDVSSNTSSINGDNGTEIAIGGILSVQGVAQLKRPVSACYFYVGRALTQQQEAEHYAAVQALQVTLNRQA